MKAPFTKKQVAAINGYQKSGYSIPMRCSVEAHDDVVVAEADGMHCPVEDCVYQRDEVDDFVATGEWRIGAQEMVNRGFKVVVDTPPS